MTAQTALWLLIAVFVSFFSFLSFVRHDNFHSNRLDLGNMEQVVWNLAHGNGFTLTDPMGDAQLSRFAIHADVLLVFMVPFYRIWQNPKVLLLIQAVVVGLGAVPLFWIAQKYLQSRKLALLFSFLYLLYPAVQRLLLHDFHAIALSITLLLFAYWHMIKRQYGRFVLFAILAALGKETTWLVVGWMGLYVGLFQGNRLGGFTLGALGFAMFVFLYWFAMPGLAPTGKHFALSYVSAFGEHQTEVVGGLVKHPGTVLSMALLPDRLAWYYRLLQPVGFLPLLSPMPLMFALHSIVINVVSSNGMMRMIDYQYNAEIIPFLFISAIEGLRRLNAWIERRKDRWNANVLRRAACIGVGGFAAVSSFLWGELPLTAEDRFYYFLWPRPEAPVIRQIAARIDPLYTVSVTNNIGAHVAGRQYLYNFPIKAREADFVLAHLGDTNAWPDGDSQRRAVTDLLANPQYELIAQTGDFYAFRRK